MQTTERSSVWTTAESKSECSEPLRNKRLYWEWQNGVTLLPLYK
jgi:hypothetical protein